MVDGARVRRAPDALEERLSVQVRVDGSDHGGRNLLRRDGEGRGRRLARLGVRRDAGRRVAVAVLAKVTHLAHVHRPRVGGDVVTHAVDVRELGLDGGSHETCAVHALLALGVRANDIEIISRVPGETSVARFDVAAPHGGGGNIELIGPDGIVGAEDGIVVDRRGRVGGFGVIESQCARRGGIERETLRGADGTSVAHQVVHRHVRQRHPVGTKRSRASALRSNPAPQRRNRLDGVGEIHEVRAGTQLVVDTVVIDDGRGCDVGDFHANLEIGGGLELVGDVDVEIDDVVNLEPREVGEGGRGRVCGECTGCDGDALAAARRASGRGTVVAKLGRGAVINVMAPRGDAACTVITAVRAGDRVRSWTSGESSVSRKIFLKSRDVGQACGTCDDVSVVFTALARERDVRESQRDAVHGASARRATRHARRGGIDKMLDAFNLFFGVSKSRTYLETSAGLGCRVITREICFD